MNYHGFTPIRTQALPELGGAIHEMEHAATGARLVWLQRPDDNKTFGIGFTTLPENSTGVFHILEHSVLCGSRSYPVKEPFVELMKNSMNTFLNAMTFPDKTVYPISSRNEKDFLNLMRVYLDAVLHPAIYEKPEIFYQEGWHYEFDENGKPSYKGVVFNEMKGAYAGADRQMGKAMDEMLFPDTCYRFSSGGDPVVIPELTYEYFRSAHSRFYSPTNSYIFLDGEVDIEKALALLEEYLVEFDRGDRVEPPAMQQPVNAGVRTVAYELGKDEALDNRYRTAWGNVIGTFADRETLTAMQILSKVLCGSNQSPLPKCILEKGLAESVNLDVQDGIAQPWVMLEVQNFRKENLEEIENLLRGEMTRLAENGLDHAQLKAELANLELKMRERDFGGMPRGLMYGLTVLESWLYGGAPEANLEVGNLFDVLREKLEQGYFEDLLRRMLLENPHTCQVIMEPSHTEGEVRYQAEQQRLADAAARWSEQEKEELLALQQRIQAWQKSEDSPEALATLPRLELTDIDPEPEHIPTEELKIAGIPVLKHAISCGGLVYCNLYFDVADLDEEGLSRVSLLGSLLGQLPTENTTAEELMNRRQLLCGSFQCRVMNYSGENAPMDCKRKFCVSFSALEENLSGALELVTEILTQTRFDGESAVLDILRQRKTGMMQMLVMAGSSVASNRVAAQNTVAGVVDEHTGGYAHYCWLKNQEENWNYEVLGQQLKAAAAQILCTSRLILSVTADADASAQLAARKLSEALSAGETGAPCVIRPWGKRKEGIAIPADISFAVKGGSVLANGGAYSGILPLASRIIGLGYLWNVIRVQGGAYGTGLRATANGAACCHSYRDPSAARSLEKYEGGPAFLRSLCQEKADLTGFIIGAVADASPVLTPRMQGTLADSRIFAGMTREILARQRRELIGCTHEQLSAVADCLEKTICDGGICVVGSQKQLEGCGLDSILTL